MSGVEIYASMKLRVEAFGLGFPVTDSVNGRVHVREMTVEYVDIADGALAPIVVWGKGFAYRKDGFEVSRSPRNVQGFWPSVPDDVRVSIETAVLSLVAKVRTA